MNLNKCPISHSVGSNDPNQTRPRPDRTHEGGQAESEAQGQGHLAGHAAPGRGLSKVDDGAEEGDHQGEQQAEAQQGVVGLHQRGAQVEEEHHLDDPARTHTNN